MPIEELKKVWDKQNQKHLYVIDEKAMHQHIGSRKNQAVTITNFSESLLIIANMGAGGFVIAVSWSQDRHLIFAYLIAAWMFISAILILVGRLRRLRNDRHFDRSIHGDLHYAISVASYQVNLSRIMRLNIIPIGVLATLSLWESRKSLWIVAGLLLSFMLVYYAAGWEHRIYERKKRELEALKSKLESEVDDNGSDV